MLDVDADAERIEGVRTGSVATMMGMMAPMKGVEVRVVSAQMGVVPLGSLATDEKILASVLCLGYVLLVSATSRIAESRGLRAVNRVSSHSRQVRQVALPAATPQTARIVGLPSTLPAVVKFQNPENPSLVRLSFGSAATD